MTYLIENLGEFKFIFETFLGYVSGDQLGSFEAKKTKSKSHAWAPLSGSICGLVIVELTKCKMREVI